jgi:cephalosporin hydroxylase
LLPLISHSNADGAECLTVTFDSKHTHEHVLANLNTYADLATFGSYYIVFDTVVEDLPAGSLHRAPLGCGQQPQNSCTRVLNQRPEFEIDKEIDNKLLISVAPNGYLRHKA